MEQSDLACPLFLLFLITKKKFGDYQVDSNIGTMQGKGQGSDIVGSLKQ